jgi:hypothetical protein
MSPGVAGTAWGVLSAVGNRASVPSSSGHLALCATLEIGDIGEVNEGPDYRGPVVARRL